MYNFENSEKGLPTRLIYDRSLPDESLKFLMRIHGVRKTDLIANGQYQNLFDLIKLPNPFKPQMDSERLAPLNHLEIEKDNSIFESIKKNEQLLFFPYHRFDYVLRFFNEAAIDPDVTEIRVTLYRIAKNSLIAHALINAAKNGKRIIVFMEVKASMDEAHNLYWAKEMGKAGITLIYSLPGLKVHAKMALVYRRVDDKVKGYAYLGTGNFNESTSKVYSDIGFFTSSKKLVNELSTVFDFLYYKKQMLNLRHLLVSPVNMTKKFVKLIDKEIEAVKNGLEGEIIIKLNNIDDHLMIDKLYEASQAGVIVKLLIRGISCLNPGIPGLSHNIQVHRIIDDFLEHLRVLIFHNKGQKKIFLSSADWMRRNLHSRVEIAFPIYDADLKNELLKFMNFQLEDNFVSNTSLTLSHDESKKK